MSDHDPLHTNTTLTFQQAKAILDSIIGFTWNPPDSDGDQAKRYHSPIALAAIEAHVGVLAFENGPRYLMGRSSDDWGVSASRNSRTLAAVFLLRAVSDALLAAGDEKTERPL